MKICRKCRKTELQVAFEKVRKTCKSCVAIRKAKYRIEHIEYFNAYSKQYRIEKAAFIKKLSKIYYKNNKEEILRKDKLRKDITREETNAARREDYRQNPEKFAFKDKKWRTNNKAKKNSINARRRASKLHRTPKWLTKLDKEKIQEYYIYAQLFTETLGIKHDVDHIIPLQGENISGLHVPINLQILTHEENIIKDNNYPWPK